MTTDMPPESNALTALESALPPDAIATNPVYHGIMEEFKQRILGGEWLPDSRLPSITHLARERQVSTGSVREALRALQSVGLVRIEHGRGVFVTGPRPTLRHFRTSETHGPELLIALAESRRILEPELAALAADRGTDDELQTILQLAQTMERDSQHGVDFVDPDMAFHLKIAQAARNPVLLRMMESAVDLMVESREITSREPGMTPRAVRYHLLIAEALRDRNAAQARLLMLAHINDTLTVLLAASGSQPPEDTDPAA